MKLFLRFLFLISMICSGQTILAQDKSSRAWDQAFAEVDSLTIKGQPKTAYALLDELSDRARSEGNSVMLIKSVIHRMLFQSKLEEDYLYKIVLSLKKDIQEAKQPEKSVLQSLLGETYWKFYQDNRYIFSQRSSLASNPGDDIRTWSLKRITYETIKEFINSTSETALLQQVEIGKMTAVLAGNSSTRNLRPTLYDLLAQRALMVLTNPQSQLTSFPDDEFKLSEAQSYSDHGTFSAMNITGDSSSFSAGALRIFQDLLKYHAAANNQAALANADLQRLRFVFQTSTSLERFSLYLKALEELAERAKNTEILPDILYEQALMYNTLTDDQGRLKPDYIKLIKIGESLISDYPESDAAGKAEALLKPVKRKNLSVQMNGFSLPGSPIQIQIVHKNTDTAYFKVYRAHLRENDQYLNNKTNFESFVNGHKKVLEWAVKLPRHSDYETHTLSDQISPLPLGDYVLIAGTSANTGAPGYETSVFPFKVTSLAVTSRSGAERVQQVMVLDRSNGKPIEAAKIETVDLRNPKSSIPDSSGPVLLTSKTGEAIMLNIQRDRGLMVSHKGDSLIVSVPYYYQDPNHQNEPRLILFTDRPIYRPGQTLFFKGLLIENQTLTNNVVPGRLVELEFLDPNGEEIGNTVRTTNEFGTFQGSFTIPLGKLNGRMHLESAYGSVEIQVEEYKRPGFELLFNKPDQKYRLNDSIRVVGKAISFSGYALSGGNVKYTIHRTIQHTMSSWIYAPPQQIAAGNTRTDAAGNFTIPFFSSVRSGRKENYTYVVKAEVTDISGETISSSTNISAGQNDILLEENLTASLFLNNKTDTIPFLLTNLNGAPVKGRLHASWTRLVAPGRLSNVSPFSRKTGKYNLSKEEFLKVFPFEAYQGDDDPANWPLSSFVQEQ